MSDFNIFWQDLSSCIGSDKAVGNSAPIAIAIVSIKKIKASKNQQLY